MVRHMPLLLLIAIGCIIIVNPYIPIPIQAALYALSITIKSCIIFVLPIIIFGLLFKSMTQLTNKATSIILFIISSMSLSNYLSTFVSGFVGTWVYRKDFFLTVPVDSGDQLEPLFNFSLPTLLANKHAMLLGLVLGIIISTYNHSQAQQISAMLYRIIQRLLSYLTFMIPLLIIGLVTKLQHDGIIVALLQNYAVIFLIISVALWCYILLLYGIACDGNLKKTFTAIQNMIPAAMVGFSSMSSAAAMPLTLIGTEKNCKNPLLANSIIPITTNFHLMGDCFAIPIFAFAILKTYSMAEPTFISYLIFSSYFVLAKFSVAAVPAGGIIVMLPILESYLNFNDPMVSLITALYILFDPVITCANILGNGAFAMIIEKIALRCNLLPKNSNQDSF